MEVAGVAPWVGVEARMRAAISRFMGNRLINWSVTGVTEFTVGDVKDTIIQFGEDSTVRRVGVVYAVLKTRELPDASLGGPSNPIAPGKCWPHVTPKRATLMVSKVTCLAPEKIWQAVYFRLGGGAGNGLSTGHS